MATKVAWLYFYSRYLSSHLYLDDLALSNVEFFLRIAPSHLVAMICTFQNTMAKLEQTNKYI